MQLSRIFICPAYLRLSPLLQKFPEVLDDYRVLYFHFVDVRMAPKSKRITCYNWDGLYPGRISTFIYRCRTLLETCTPYISVILVFLVVGTSELRPKSYRVLVCLEMKRSSTLFLHSCPLVPCRNEPCLLLEGWRTSPCYIMRRQFLIWSDATWRFGVESSTPLTASVEKYSFFYIHFAFVWDGSSQPAPSLSIWSWLNISFLHIQVPLRLFRCGQSTSQTLNHRWYPPGSYDAHHFPPEHLGHRI